ncbi:MAG: hypothetical protein KAS94_10685 [Desulfobulbaceae bacterium]|nr:hypothetical protein [Desulfobulbaceae bacterium]
MGSMKKSLFLVALFISFQLLFSSAGIARAPQKRADVFINEKYSRPISYDPRWLDKDYVRGITDKNELNALLRTREISYVPYRITTSGGAFYVSVNTVVMKDGIRIEIDDLPVPCTAYVFFYEQADRSTPGAVKIVIKNVEAGAVSEWTRPKP